MRLTICQRHTLRMHQISAYALPTQPPPNTQNPRGKSVLHLSCMALGYASPKPSRPPWLSWHSAAPAPALSKSPVHLGNSPHNTARTSANTIRIREYAYSVETLGVWDRYADLQLHERKGGGGLEKPRTWIIFTEGDDINNENPSFFFEPLQLQ